MPRGLVHQESQKWWDFIIHDSLLLNPYTHTSLPRVRNFFLGQHLSALLQSPGYPSNSSSSPPSSDLIFALEILPYFQRHLHLKLTVHLALSYLIGWPIIPWNLPQGRTSFLLLKSLHDLLYKFSRRFGAGKVVFSIFLMQKQWGEKQQVDQSPFFRDRQVGW